MIKEYNFEYTKANEGEDHSYAHLVKVTPNIPGGDQLNSTVIEWGNDLAGFNTGGFINRDKDAKYVTTGDFNGDGISDVFIVYKENDSKRWKLYHGRKTGFFHEGNNGNLDDNFKRCFVGDLNDDGKSDIIGIYKDTKCRRRMELLISNGNGFASPIESRVQFNTIDQVLPGDFNGDGSIDLLRVGYKNPSSEDCTYGDYNNWWIKTFSNVHNDFINLKTGNDLFLDDADGEDQVLVSDFDGDGKTDILVLWDRNTDICKIYDWNLNIIYENTGWPTKWHDMYPGDFNGDGKADLLTWNGSEWKLHLFKGNNSFKNGINVPISIDPSKDNNYITVNDYNGDGKSDILEAYTFKDNDDNDHTTMTIYYSMGYDIEYNTYNYLSETNTWGWKLTKFKDNYNNKFNRFNDFNGDGKIDYLYTDNKEDYFTVEFNADEQLNLAQKITNGLNNTTYIYYNTLAKADVSDNNSFYKVNQSNIDYPLRRLRGALYVVTSVNQPNGLGSTNAIEYKYKEGLVHLRGKGFLGFEQQTIENNATGLKTINTFNNKNNPFYNTVLEETIQKRNGHDLSTTTLVNNKFTSPDNDKCYFPYIDKKTVANELNGTSVETDFEYDDNGNITKKVIDYGNSIKTTTEYLSYVDAGSHIAWKPETIEATKAHPDHDDDFKTKVNFSYDANNGNLLSKTINAQSTDKSITTYYNYDKFGNFEKKRIIPKNMPEREITYQYDGTGRFIEEQTNYLGTVKFTYDHKTGNQLTKTGITGLKTTYQYDDWGRQHKTILPDGQEVTQTTNWFNGSEPQHALYYQETSQPGSPDTKNYYDRLGRTLREETEVYGGKTNYSQTTYNAKGQVTSEFASLYDGETEHTTFYTYKNNGRLDTKTLPTGKSIDYDYGTTANGYYTSQTVTTGNLTREYRKDYLPNGDLLKATDPGGSITYKYHSNGQTKEILYPGGTVSMDYDDCGNQTLLDDSDAGTMDYRYNAAGDLTYQKDDKGNEFWLFYDAHGRLQKKTTDAAGNNIIAAYTYVASSNGKGQVKTITGDPANGVSKAYEYDNYNRLKKTTEAIQGEQFTREYKYDDYGNIAEVNHSNELTIKNNYNGLGYLTSVKANDKTVWALTKLTAREQGYNYGNGLSATNTFDAFGYPKKIQTSGAQYWEYDFDQQRGNLLSRQNVNTIGNNTETFTYDNNFDRLTKIERDNYVLAMAYNEQDKHNMNTKSDVGSLKYNQTNNAGVHAVTGIESLTDRAETLPDHEIDYTPFNKVSHISEPVNNKDMYFMYGPEYNRKTMTYKKDGDLQYTRYYSGNCEKSTFANGDKRKVYYISGGDGLAAAWVKENGQASLYYIHTDHLGSICAITDKDQNVVANYSFDAWGNRRDPETWELSDTWDESFTSRGFTGHEHIDEFGLINMNGRVYDPTIGMFLSPDNYVQLPDYSLGFNRYAYALNNPLIYTDPDGESFSLTAFGIFVTLSTAGIIIMEYFDDDYDEDVPQGPDINSKIRYVPESNLPSGDYSEMTIPGVQDVDVDATLYPNGCTFGVAEMVNRWYGGTTTYQDYAYAYDKAYPGKRAAGNVYFRQVNNLFYYDFWSTESMGGSGYNATSDDPGSKEDIKDALDCYEVVVAQMNNRHAGGIDHNILIYGYREYPDGELYLLYKDPQGGLPETLYLDYDVYIMYLDYAQAVYGAKDFHRKKHIIDIELNNLSIFKH